MNYDILKAYIIVWFKRNLEYCIYGILININKQTFYILLLFYKTGMLRENSAILCLLVKFEVQLLSNLVYSYNDEKN